MPQVDFYILPENRSRERFICILINKIWQQGYSVYIHTGSKDAAQALDNLLWTYQDISFVPHTLSDMNQPNNEKICIDWHPEINTDYDIFINLADEIPQDMDKFARIVEIVAGNETDKKIAREHYRQFRNLGYELHNHTID